MFVAIVVGRQRDRRGGRRTNVAAHLRMRGGRCGRRAAVQEAHEQQEHDRAPNANIINRSQTVLASVPEPIVCAMPRIQTRAVARCSLRHRRVPIRRRT